MTEKSRRICLFGIGALLNDCFQQIVLYLGREPDFLCDNAQEKWGKIYFGKKCISPAELGDMCDGMSVIITVKNYEDIYLQLSGMGIEDVYVSCYDRCYNTIHDIKKLGVNRMPAAGWASVPVSVKGKWTLITGAARGIGFHVALEMAKQGSNIIAHSRSIPHVRKLVNECSAFGVQTVPIAAEFSNLNEVEEMLLRLEDLVPQIDIVFNNAAVSPPCTGDFWSVSGHDYLTSFTVNSIAPIRISLQLIPPMIQRRFGRIINITSSIRRRPFEMAYACSKAALDKFVYDLAPSLQYTGVTLTLVDPGWLRTDMGGPNALHAAESVIPGALLGALLDDDFNGHWFSAQDYTGLSIEAAIQKAKFISASSPVRNHDIQPVRMTLEAK